MIDVCCVMASFSLSDSDYELGMTFEGDSQGLDDNETHSKVFISYSNEERRR